MEPQGSAEHTLRNTELEEGRQLGNPPRRFTRIIKPKLKFEIDPKKKVIFMKREVFYYILCIFPVSKETLFVVILLSLNKDFIFSEVHPLFVIFEF